MDADVEPRAFGQLTYLQNLIFTFHTDKKHRRLAKAYAWKNYLSQVVDVMDVCVPACTVNILTILSGRADDAIFSAMADGMPGEILYKYLTTTKSMYVGEMTT